MDDLVNLIIQNESPAQISDGIKDLLNIKALEKIDSLYPDVAANLFSVEEQ